MTDDRRNRVKELLTHLEATAELPVDTAVSRSLGEAEAVAADAVDAPENVVETRVAQVRDLLEHVEATGNDEADEHVQAARALVEKILT